MPFPLTEDGPRKIREYGQSLTNILFGAAVFNVPDALSVGIIFSHYDVPRGAAVFVYAPNYQYMKGAYTDENILPSHQLALPHLPGSMFYVEYNVPSEQYKPNQLAIGRVAGGIIDVFGFQEKNKRRNCCIRSM